MKLNTLRNEGGVPSVSPSARNGGGTYSWEPMEAAGFFCELQGLTVSFTADFLSFQLHNS